MVVLDSKYRLELNELVDIDFANLDQENVVFFVRFKDFIEEIDLLKRYLNNNDIVKLSLYKCNQRKSQFIIARVFLKMILSFYLGSEDIRSISLNYDEFGKLKLKDNQLFFNISHCNGAAVIAVSKYVHIGVDIEYVFRKVSCLKIAKRFFSKKEFEWLSIQDSAKCVYSFFDIWTAKEAVGKAVGIGLRLSMDSFTISIQDYLLNQTSLLSISSNQFLCEDTKVALKWISLGEAYSCCVAGVNVLEPVNIKCVRNKKKRL